MLIFFQDWNNILTFSSIVALLSLLFSFQGAMFTIESYLIGSHQSDIFSLAYFSFFIKKKSKWWAWEDSNLRPYAYQAYALTTWATSPCHSRRWSLEITSAQTFRPALRRHWSFLCFLSFSKERKWWRWGESNSWPPACKAGALPAELHPHFFNRARKQFRLSFHHFEGTCFSFAERTKFAFFAAFAATKAFFAFFLSRKKEGLCLLN